MSILERAHENIVFNRRVSILSKRISELLPRGARVLDVGCGSGLIASLVLKYRPDVSIAGIDVLVRSGTCIPVNAFDGKIIPHGDESFDCVLFVDVLHHDETPENLLKEARRVSRNMIIIKDHVKKGILANATLRLMDRVGNARFGVNLPYNYWTEHEWHEKLAGLGLFVEQWNSKIGLYPFPATLLFDRSLHFIAKLRVK